MSAVQSYWLAVAAVAGAVSGVGTDAAYNRLMPQQVQPVQSVMQQAADQLRNMQLTLPVLEQLHADLIALRGDTSKQSVTLDRMHMIMQRGEAERQTVLAKQQAYHADLGAEMAATRQAIKQQLNSR